MDKFSIITERKYIKAGAYRIVYEWEDIISKGLKIPLVNTVHPTIGTINNLLSKFGLNFLSTLFYLGKRVIRFQMIAQNHSNSFNASSVIPWIIDFYLPVSAFSEFFEATKRNKIVLISSNEVFQLLRDHKSFDDKKYFHLPLSFPDNYSLSHKSNFEKKYDCVLVGRQDSLLKQFVDKYANDNPNFTYVYSVKTNNYNKIVKQNIFEYYTNSGKLIGTDSENENYLNIVQSCKVGLWSTRGLEDKVANGYNQVTPRFFELLASGCHVICRYAENADTDFFQISDFCESINTYESFKTKMDIYLSKPIDIIKYSDYLKNHYTSARLPELERIINL